MSNGEAKVGPGLPSEVEKEALRTLVRGIVLAQGNIFIKEFLRSKGITIGDTKADFESNLLEAIEKGQLRQIDVEVWLREVEGWGDQHVYLYHIPDEVGRDRLWSTPAAIQRRLQDAGLGKLWNAQASLEFPEKRSLTGIYFEDHVLRFIWHERQVFWVRTPERDEEKDWKGDHYQLRAFRERMDRSVMRFEMRLSLGLAAIFLQVPWNKKEHEAALTEITQAISPVLDLKRLSWFQAATAIKKLDQAEFNKSAAKGISVAAQRTRLSDAGIYVEFASTSEDLVYKDSEAVRNVRKAVRADQFTGSTAMFVYEQEKKGAPKRKIKIELIGPERRIRLWAQLNAAEVWEILKLLGKNG